MDIAFAVRPYPDKFYTLPQSPRQYKQILMVADFNQYRFKDFKDDLKCILNDKILNN